MKQHKILNKKYEILTPNGWEKFESVLKNEGKQTLKILYSNNKKIGSFTLNHRLFKSENEKILVKNINIGDNIFSENGKIKITNIEYIKTNETFDIFNTDNHKFLVNSGTYSSNCDEIGFVPANIADEFWAANYPTLSASKTSKIIVISTPNGMYNLFHILYSEAERGYNGFAWCKYDYSVIPGRDEKWVEKERRILGDVRFNQEHLVQFLGSTNTVIDAKILEYLISNIKSPIQLSLNDRLRIFEIPIENQKYVIGVDVGKGTGEHYSTIQILKIISINPFKAEQVAVFQDNYTDIYSFGDIIYRLAIYYNNAHLIVENNAEGMSIVNKIWWDYEYENLINESSKSTGLGVRATKKTKPKAVIIMKKLIENGDLILYDKYTIDELMVFIETTNNIFKGKDKATDDLVSGLYWSCYITEFDVFQDNITIDTQIDEDGWGILTDVLIVDNSWLVE